jgi:glycosyltransferase involved in cell wall biosynthesis
VSVIIPLGPDESTLGRLAADLLLLPDDFEIVLVSCPASMGLSRQLKIPARLAASKRLRRVDAAQGRAVQLNAGAAAASGQFLWFVHADSGLTPWVVEQLLASITEQPRALHCFGLRFAVEGGVAPWIGLNAAGANLRSRWLKVPFGDQAFCLAAPLFQQLSGYDQTAAYGEDHLLVWQARRMGLKVNLCRAVITTSARKYHHHGWLTLTLRYQWLWIKQALPQAWALWRKR